MDYYQLLNKAIAESGFSLRQIAKRCSDEGVAITPSYISQLKNGKLPPPSWEVTSALAKALHTKDESRLIFQGYFEKAPEVIKEYMLASSELNKILLEALCKSTGDTELTRKANEFLAQLDILSNVKTPSKYIQDDKFIIPKKSEEELTYRISEDDMEPLLPKGSMLILSDTSLSLLKNKDIIVFKSGIKTLVRRLFITEEDILLIPENKDRELIRIYGFDEIDFIGKLVSYQVYI